MDNNFSDFINNNFKFIKILGDGSYGKVYLALHKQSNKPYAIKIQQKNLLQKQGQVSYALSELKILKKISNISSLKDQSLSSDSFNNKKINPYFAEINYFYQDSKYIYFILDYIPGGELFSLLRKEKVFTISNAKFYICQIIDILAYLHKNFIIYRDLKPENCLLDSYGYIKIIDFGVSKMVSENNNKTKTLAGTPTYMAPEVVKNEPYSFEVDWWSLGILSYEMTVGTDPWGEDDPVLIYKKIKEGKIYFPKKFDKKLKNFIQHLLIGDPQKRMGIINKENSNEFSKDFSNNLSNTISLKLENEYKKLNIYEHIFVRTFPWKELRNKQINPWYIPKVEKIEEDSYDEFSDDSCSDIEEDKDPFLDWNEL